MKVLLDTHIAIWAIADAPALPATARRLILDGANDIFVSDISAWEIAIKSVARPGSIPFGSGEFVEACMESGYRFPPVSREAIIAYEGLDYAAVGDTVGKTSSLSTGRGEGFSLIITCYDALLSAEIIFDDMYNKD